MHDETPCTVHHTFGSANRKLCDLKFMTKKKKKVVLQISEAKHQDIKIPLKNLRWM